MTIFLNTGSPLYDGVTFTSGPDLLELIKSSLVSANWYVIASSTNELKVRGQSLSDFCYFLITITNANELNIRGSLTDDFNSLSPVLAGINLLGIANLWRLVFTPNMSNRVWVTADNDCFIIMIADAMETSNLYSAWRFGFYDRWNANDAWAWGLGPLYTFEHYHYVAKSAYNNTNWWSVSDSFSKTDLTNPPSFCGSVPPNYPLEGLLNVYSQAISYGNYAGDYYSGYNVAKNRHFGNVNGVNGLVEPGLHYLLEGYGTKSIINHKLDDRLLGSPLFFRGSIKYVATGFAHAQIAGTRYDFPNGSVFISPGPLALGMQVK